MSVIVLGGGISPQKKNSLHSIIKLYHQIKCRKLQNEEKSEMPPYAGKIFQITEIFQIK